MSETAKPDIKIIQTTIVKDLTRRHIFEKYTPWTHDITVAEERFDVVIETFADGIANVTLRPRVDVRYVRDATSIDSIIAAKDPQAIYESRVYAIIATLATDSYKEIARRLRSDGSVTL